jgi:hypothetical protein
MPPSKDPGSAQRSWPTWQRTRRSNTAPTARLGLSRFAAELSARFGGVASADEIWRAADRRAKVEVTNDWLAHSGLLADKRSRRPRAVLGLADRLQSSYERQLTELGHRRGTSTVEPPSVALSIKLARTCGWACWPTIGRFAQPRRTGS